MDVLAHICASIATAHFLFWKLVDHAVSKTYPMHTTGEKNDLWQGKDGYYDSKKGLLTIAIPLAIAVPLWIFLSPWTPALILGIWGVALLLVIPKNREKMLRCKAEQFKELERVNLLGPLYQARPRADFENGTRRPIWWANPHFLDVRCYAEGPTNDYDEAVRAREVLTAKMRALAAKPKSEWWKVDRARNL